jgi:hypothetical protein
MKFIPNRPKFSITVTRSNGAPLLMDLTTADLVRQALIYCPPQVGGLSVQDVLMLNDIMPRVAGAVGVIELENAEMEHLQKKVEACRWSVWSPEVATFIREVRAALDVKAVA